MIKLQGSEKQVTWANELRNTNIKRLEREIEELKLREINGTGSFPELVAKLEKAVIQIKNDTVHVNASWWIENKNLANAYIQKIKRA